MRIRFFMFAVFAVMMAFTACTKEKVVYVENGEGLENQNGIELKEGEGVIKISLSNGMSRAARPITSNAAVNNINRILFKFVSDTSDGTEFTEFNVDGILDDEGKVVGGSEGTNQNHILVVPSTYQSQGTVSVKFSGLKKGNYKIYAFGYNNENTESKIPFSLAYQQENGTYLCQLLEYDTEVEELFVGVTGTDQYQTVSVNQYSKFDDEIEIKLYRQVAGLMAYMKNIPQYINDDKNQPQLVKRITVSTYKKTNGLYAPISLYTEDAFNGYNDELVYYDWLTFDIPDDAGVDNDGYYTFNGDYVLATQNAGYGFSFTDGKEPKPNTLFGSCFLYAYATGYYTTDHGTLNIRYWGDNLETPIKTVALNDGNRVDFQIECNHFYAIGHLADWDKDGDGDPDEGVDDDPLPIDLESGLDNLKVTVSDGWEQTVEVDNTDLKGQ